MRFQKTSWRRFNHIFLFLAVALSIIGFSRAALADDPTPTLTITVPGQELISDSFDIAATLENTSGDADDIGFYPMMQILLPAGIVRNGAATVSEPSGAPVTAFSEFGGIGVVGATYQNPVTGEDVTIADDETLIFITIPVGTLAVGQSAVEINLPVKFETTVPNAVVGTAEDITGKGIFALGDIPNGVKGDCGAAGIDTICVDAIMVQSTPSIITIDLSGGAAAGGRDCTGSNYPRNFSLTSDVATSGVVDNVVISSTIPEEIVLAGADPGDCSGTMFAINPAPDSCTFIPSINGGGTISATYTQITGAGGNDVTITYSGYVQESVGAVPVIDPATGIASSSSNTATADYEYASAAQPQLSDNVTISQNSVDLTKSVTVTDNAPTGNSPGDTLNYTVNVCVSDYFSFDDLIVDDDIQDGQTYTADTFSVRVIEDGTTTTQAAGSDAAFGGALAFADPAPPHKDGSGITHIDLDLSGLMTGAMGLGDGTIDGGANPASVQIQFQTMIDEDYVAGFGGGNTGIIDSGDTISNDVDIDFQVEGTANRQDIDNTSASVTIVQVTDVAKSYACKNSVCPAADNKIAAGDEVTFKITTIIPTGDVENFKITDYLPTPLFNVQDPDNDGANEAFASIAQGDAAPAAGEWRFTSASTLTPAADSVTQDGNSNSIVFDFADNIEDGGGSAEETIEILFTITATSEPMADGLQLVNVAFTSHANSAGEATINTISSIVDVETETPQLTIEKVANAVISGDGSVSSNNFIGVDAEDELEYKVTITNTGSEMAYIDTDDLGDIFLIDDLPSFLVEPGGGHQIEVIDGGGAGECQCDDGTDTWDLCGAGGHDADTASTVAGDVIKITDMRIEGDGTCTITYHVTIDSSALFGDEIENTATIEYTSENAGTKFSPESDTATATMEEPEVTKDYQLGSSDNAETADTALAIGEQITFEFDVATPEGTANNFKLIERNDNGTPRAFDTASIIAGDLSFPTGAIEQSCSNVNPPYNTYYNFDGLEDLCFENDPSNAANHTANASSFTIDFGTLANFDTDNVDDTFTVEIDMVVNDGVVGGNKSNRSRINWDNSDGTQADNENEAFSVDKPHLTLTKTTSTAQPVTMGQVIHYTITVENDGDTTAYDIDDIADTLQAGLAGATLVSADYDGTNVTADVTVNQVGQNVSITVRDDSDQPDIAAGDIFTVNYDVTVQGTMVNDTTDGPGHPGGITDTPGAVNDLSNNADIANYYPLDGAAGGAITDVASDSVTRTLDSDNDGLLNSLEIGEGDSDGDGVPDYLDTDSDDNDILGDGTDGTDGGEYGGGADLDGDGTADYIDDDDEGDGADDWDEITAGGGDPSNDADGDGNPDYRDPDSDNDGVADGTEAGADVSLNTDGVGGNDHNDMDSDSDGIPDLVEYGLWRCDDGSGGGVASNGSLEPGELAACTDVKAPLCAAANCDADGNGAVEADEFIGGTLPDFDGDAVANARELDSDNDGLTDLSEAGLATCDDGSGGGVANNSILEAGELTACTQAKAIVCLNATCDDDANGIINYYEYIGLTLPDTDVTDGLNFLDIDSDGDLIGDIIEGGRYVCDANLNGTIDYDGEIDGCAINDTNGNHFLDILELALVDQDGDGLPRYTDLDSDGDTISDAHEVYDAANAAPGAVITLFADLEDTDVDGTTPDWLDSDSDDDNISDADEAGDAVLGTYPINTDEFFVGGDDLPNYRDDDSDADEIPDITEAGDVPLATIPIDTDGDGDANYIDVDSDADGLLDILEKPADATDYASSYVVYDSDGDGCSDGCEVHGIQQGEDINACPFLGNAFTAPLIPPAPIPADVVTDPMDADTDDGGTGDCVEGFGGTDPVADPTDDAWNDEDPDNDGCTNSEEVATGCTDINNPDTDGDGIDDCTEINSCSDPCDADTDDDGLNDGEEVNTYSTDQCDEDTDGDGCSDGSEVNISGTDPLDTDSDDDGIDDCTEASSCTDPLDADTDDDGLSDGDEVNIHGTDPCDADTDGGGVPDGEEVDLGNDPLDDEDDEVECTLATDRDGDGRPDALDPSKFSTDENSDGIPDCCLDASATQNLLDYDHDGDGFSDCEEFNLGADPTDSHDIDVQGSGLDTLSCSWLPSDSNAVNAIPTALMLMLSAGSIWVSRKKRRRR